MMINFLYVAIGGALGAMGRYGGSVIIDSLSPSSFPLATMIINILGSFLMGLLVIWLLSKGESETQRLLLGVGFLGGFTTFSAFSLEAMGLLKTGLIPFLVYVFGSVVISLLAIGLGLYLGRQIWGG